jgi:hypothetical protein
MRYSSKRSLIGSGLIHVVGVACLLLVKIAFQPKPQVISIESGVAQTQAPTIVLPDFESQPTIHAPEAYFDEVEAKEFAFEPSIEIESGSGRDSPGGTSGNSSASSQRRFAQVVSGFAENGLDLVIVFDSTSSMTEEIDDLKTNLSEIAKTLFAKLPKTRISVVFYRDTQDPVSVDGLPLCTSHRPIARYLTKVQAAGGGMDAPELVSLGLQTAVERNIFRPKAHKVLLLIGDAPPHDVHKCRQWAAHFRRSLRGRVSTITCGQASPITAFNKIARSGDGESIALQKKQRIVPELSLLLFGKEHRVEAQRFLANNR